MYENSNYIINDTFEDTEICVSSISPGIDEMFTANIRNNAEESKPFLHCMLNN